MIFQTFNEYCKLQEAAASMSRFFSQAKGDELLAIISASRESKPIMKFSQDNRGLSGYTERRRKGRRQSWGATRDMEKEIRQGWEARFGVDHQGAYKSDFQNRMGFKKTYGTYPEEKNDGSGLKVRVLEQSIWCVHPHEGLENIPPQEIVKFFLDLAEKYQQIGVIIRLPGESQAYEYYTSHSSETPGSRRPYNDPHRESNPPYSTRLRKQSPDHHLTYNPDFENSPQHPASWQGGTEGEK